MFNFNYDPQRQGYDTGLFKTLTGTPAVSGTKLRFSSAKAIQYGDCLRGNFKFLVTIPATPTAAYLTGGGSALSQMPGLLTGGASATAVAATWAAVSNGAFKVTIDGGTETSLTAIDFTGAATMAAVASIIQVKLRLATGGLESVAWDTNHFVITATKSVSVLSAGASGTDISGAGATAFMDGDTGHGTATVGWNNISDGEFTITINEETIDVIDLDFSGAADIDAVAAIIQTGINALVSGREAVTVVWDVDHFLITGLSVVSVASAVAGGAGTDISGAGSIVGLDSDTGNGTATSGDSKYFGLINLATDAKVAFRVFGDKLRCISSLESGGQEITDITWQAAWTATEIPFRIDWSGQSVLFFVNNVQVATHNDDANPRSTLSIFVQNDDADNLDFGLFDAQGLESYL